MKEKYADDHIVPTGTYIAVWLALLVLLAATIAVARLRLLAQFSVVGSLMIASVNCSHPRRLCELGSCARTVNTALSSKTPCSAKRVRQGV